MGIGHLTHDSAVALQPCPSGHITADKRFRYASPNCLQQLLLSANRYIKCPSPPLKI